MIFVVMFYGCYHRPTRLSKKSKTLDTTGAVGINGLEAKGDQPWQDHKHYQNGSSKISYSSSYLFRGCHLLP